MGAESHNMRGRESVAMRAILAGLLAGTLSLAATGCAQQGGTVGDGTSQPGDAGASGSDSTSAPALKTESEIPTDGSPLSLIDAANFWSKRDLDPSYAEYEATTVVFDGDGENASGADASSVTASGDTLTISGEGIYILSGKSDSMGIVVDAPADAKVQLVLAGLSLSCDGGACLHVKSADKVFLTVKDGTENSLASTGELADADGADGTVFSKADLTVNGAGSLSVTSEAGNGVVGKDEVTLVSSVTAIDAPKGHAIDANDNIAIHGGTWDLSSGKDGLHSENDDDQTKGWVYADGGTISIAAGTDGIDAGSQVQIDGGSLSLECGDDGIHAELDLVINGGTVDVTRCAEGVEGGTVTITAGDVSVTADDDGINATGTPDKSADGAQGDAGNGMPDFGNGFPGKGAKGGQVADGDDQGPDDGQQAGRGSSDGNGSQPPATPDGGMPSNMESDTSDRPSPPAMPEGMEPPSAPRTTTGDRQGTPSGNGESESGTTGGQGESVTGDAESQGTTPQGDGQGGQRPSGMPGGGFGMMGSDETAILTISGGHVTVDAKGDGIDCNGLIHVTGGQTCVYGPTSDGNSAMDYGTELRIDGGELVAVGSSGMAEDVSSESKQASMTVFLDEGTTGDASVSVGNNSIAECSPTRQYSMLLVSTPAMRDGGTYDVRTGDKVTSVKMDGRVTVSGTRSSFMGGKAPGGQQAGFQPREFSAPEDLVGQRVGTPRSSDGQ